MHRIHCIIWEFFLLIGFKNKQTNKQTKTRTATQLCAKLASKLTWNNYFNVYLYHTYKWQRILNHCDIDGISYCRILLLTNTRTFTNATTFSVENRLLRKRNSGRGFALSDADTLPQSNQASFSFIFAPFSDTSFQSARLNFSHWNNTEKNCTFSLFETSLNGNVTFAYIMTFHFHSVYWGYWPYWLASQWAQYLWWGIWTTYLLILIFLT